MRSLFKSAATYYAEFRVPYPKELVARVVAECGLDGRQRLLDLVCFARGSRGEPGSVRGRSHGVVAGLRLFGAIPGEAAFPPDPCETADPLIQRTRRRDQFVALRARARGAPSTGKLRARRRPGPIVRARSDEMATGGCAAKCSSRPRWSGARRTNGCGRTVEMARVGGWTRARANEAQCRHEIARHGGATSRSSSNRAFSRLRSSAFIRRGTRPSSPRPSARASGSEGATRPGCPRRTRSATSRRPP